MKTNEKNVINEISKDLKFWEKIIVRMNKRLFVKIYHKERIKIINTLLK